MSSLAVRLALVALLAPALARAADPAPAAKPAAAAAPVADENTLYALGVHASRSLKQYNLTAKELEAVKRGLTDALTGQKLKVDMEKYDEKVQKLAEARLAKGAQANKEAGKAYAAKAAGEKGAQKTASGLVFTSLKEGTGAAPKQTDIVKVHYEGKFIDGTVFDSSLKRGQPGEIPVAGSLPCLSEGLSKMKVGGKARMVCPSSIAYGDAGRPPVIAGGATLVFEVELLDVGKMTPPPGGPHGGGMPPGMPPGTPPHGVAPPGGAH